MQFIKNNPVLSLNSLKDKLITPFNTILVNSRQEHITRELFHAIIHALKFKLKNGTKLTLEEAIEKHLFEYKIIIEPKLKDYEWILVTENEVYYSKGDNSA